jgi:hypothetical protein
MALAAFVLFVVLTGVGGPHGPARHSASEAAGHPIPAGLLVLLAVLAIAAVALNWRAPWNWLGRLAWPHIAIPAAARRPALVTHVASSVGSLGAVAAFLALALAGLISEDSERVRGCYLAMEMIARFVILPLIIASLISGVVSSLASPWGIFQHYWVLVKLLLNILVLVVLLLQIDGISAMAAAASRAPVSDAALFGLRTSLLVHAAGGVVVLLIATVLGIYKPRGVTPYGTLKQARKA